MARKSAQDLILEAQEKGITLTGNETYSELVSLVNGDTGLSQDEETQAKAAAEAITKKEERLFTKDEVAAMLQQVLAKQQAKDEDSADEKEKPVVHIPRFENKFILGFKNMNTDPYAPDLVVHAVDVFDNNTKQNVPWVTVVYEDKSEKLLPLRTVIERSTKVKCEIVERKKEDVSYDFGKVEKIDVKDGSYAPEGTGALVKTKVTQYREWFIVKTPTGEILEVQPEVVNWSAGGRTPTRSV